MSLPGHVAVGKRLQTHPARSAALTSATTASVMTRQHPLFWGLGHSPSAGGSKGVVVTPPLGGARGAPPPPEK